MVSLVRQNELTETAQALNEKLHAEITAQEGERGISRQRKARVSRTHGGCACARDQQSSRSGYESLTHRSDAELKRIAHITRQTLGFYRETELRRSFTLRHCWRG
jgi:hypothetical protein